MPVAHRPMRRLNARSLTSVVSFHVPLRMGSCVSCRSYGTRHPALISRLSSTRPRTIHRCAWTYTLGTLSNMMQPSQNRRCYTPAKGRPNPPNSRRFPFLPHAEPYPPSEDLLPPSHVVDTASAVLTMSGAGALEAMGSGRGGPLAFPVLLVLNPSEITTSNTPSHECARNRVLPHHTARATRPPPRGSILRRRRPYWLFNLRTLLATRLLASTHPNSQQIAH
jgi:hypothetical protein